MALIDDLRNKLTNIADAIREKNGVSDKIKMDDMPDAIRNITSGGTTGSITKLQMAKITGLTSEMTATNIGIADHIVKTVSTGGNDASVSIDDTTYLYSNVSTSPVVSEDGSLKLSYGNLKWTLTALASMTDEYGNSYNQNDVIKTWGYNSSYIVMLFL